MASIFSRGNDRPVTVTMELLELLSAKMESVEDSFDVAVAVSEVLTDYGVRDQGGKEITYVIERIDSLRIEEEGRSTDAGSKTGDHFGSYALDWLSNMKPDQLCMYLADYDYEKALFLYCELDRDDVVAMSTNKIDLEWERMRISFEAALFASGGSYGGGGSKSKDEGEVTVYDLTGGDTSALSKFFGKAH